MCFQSENRVWHREAKLVLDVSIYISVRSYILAYYPVDRYVMYIYAKPNEWLKSSPFEFRL